MMDMISYFGDFCVKYPYGKILLQEKQINVCERRKKEDMQSLSSFT